MNVIAVVTGNISYRVTESKVCDVVIDEVAINVKIRKESVGI